MLLYPYGRWRYRKPRFATRLNRRHPLAQSLVGCWLLNRGFGTTAFDSAGNNPGTLHNFAFPPTLASGWNSSRYGTVLKYDAIDDVVNIVDSPSMRFADGNFSISFRFKADTVADNKTLMGSESSIGGARGWRFWFSGTSSINFGVNDGSGLIVAQELNTIATATWYRLVGTVDSGNTVDIYIDGVSKDPTALGGDTDFEKNAGFQIGNAETTGGRFYDGIIDDLSIFNCTLTPAQVMSLHMRPYQMFEYPPIWMYAEELAVVRAKTSYAFIM